MISGTNTSKLYSCCIWNYLNRLQRQPYMEYITVVQPGYDQIMSNCSQIIPVKEGSQLATKID